jgi:C1A family cysteine protease
MVQHNLKLSFEQQQPPVCVSSSEELSPQLAASAVNTIVTTVKDQGQCASCWAWARYHFLACFTRSILMVAM